MHRGWARLGDVRAIWVVASFFGLALIASLLFDDATAEGVGVGLLAGLIIYCVARPRDGWEIFAATVAPAAASTLLNDVVGTPRWLGLVLVPFALGIAWDVDKPTDAT